MITEEITNRKISDKLSTLIIKIEDINDIEELMSPKVKIIAKEKKAHDDTIKELGNSGAVAVIGSAKINEKKQELENFTNKVDDLAEKVGLLSSVNSICNKEKAFIIADVNNLLSVSSDGFITSKKVNNADEEITYALKNILKGRKNGIELSQDIANKIEKLISPKIENTATLKQTQKL